MKKKKKRRTATTIRAEPGSFETRRLKATIGSCETPFYEPWIQDLELECSFYNIAHGVNKQHFHHNWQNPFYGCVNHSATPPWPKNWEIHL